ncbi:MAG: NUDIX hydrolase [Candidatus Andersenbacteria bacterium CG10_big_fil_rev_8_21_14_0_10_54_11]|uniref:NUDIX hydrolase n=1 Tax=Candidatus Andersenbacteria bacterium CG10_big_fil_rev_8_21_14_0_10_54_11 TaxID=1974485 RepID=A0A2M6WZT4_9BACT|nr:MAG: NUDIX hydrolase [Candidatus Andersenbacteria bacterium CG10_big_fil_rev_8_21_14_0_10_54_11]
MTEQLASSSARKPRRSVRRETSAGGVVAREENGAWFVALLKTEHKRGEVWVLPKGHVEPHEGETASDAAKREVMEEAGITDVSLRDQLGITRYAFQAEEALVKKTVHYFLMTTQQKKLTPQAEEGLIDAAWTPIDEAVNLLAYDTDQDIVAKARQRLLGSLPPNYPPPRRTRRAAAPRRPAAKPTRKNGTSRLRLHI